MKKMSDNQGKKYDHVRTIRKPFAQLNYSQNSKIVKKKSQTMQSYTRRSNTNILACKKSFDLPEIPIKARNNSTRKKLYTEWVCEEPKQSRSNFNSIFRRDENKSIDKELQKLESLHNIHKNLMKELGSIETMVLDMSLKKYVRLNSLGKVQTVLKYRS